jgi:hypothetical protein
MMIFNITLSYMNYFYNRISEVAGARLKSNNPAITDLSDQNRPSKLAEKFSELYDNEWTDAAEEMKQMLTFSEDAEEEERDVAVAKFLLEFTKVTNLSLFAKKKKYCHS